jgi:hypothetical protein
MSPQGSRGRAQHHRHPATPNDHSERCRSQDPLINDLAGGLLLGPTPPCYQLNVACDLSERRLLINDFAAVLHES